MLGDIAVVPLVLRPQAQEVGPGGAGRGAPLGSSSQRGTVIAPEPNRALGDGGQRLHQDLLVR